MLTSEEGCASPMYGTFCILLTAVIGNAVIECYRRKQIKLAKVLSQHPLAPPRSTTHGSGDIIYLPGKLK